MSHKRNVTLRGKKRGSSVKKIDKPGRKKCSADHGAELKELFRWLLPKRIFLKRRVHGNTKWKSASLVWMAVCWAWCEAKNVTDAFTHSAEWMDSLNRSSVPKTYQGFIRALTAAGDELVSLVRSCIHKRLPQIGRSFWRYRGRVLFAFDGSRETVARTRSNEAAFCAKNYGHGKTAKYRRKKTKGMRRRKNEKNKPQPQEPQIWLTMIWQVTLRIPWTWRLGPSDSGERAHVLDMLKEEEFPEKSLFCGDAGFVGYSFWSALVKKGHDFLVRVGGNVRLLSEVAAIHRIGDNIVYSWPKDAERKNLPPLRLRLVKIRFKDNSIWMLTSVLSSRELSKRDIKAIYKKRWGVEVEFRGLKQTLGRRKLRCRNPERAKTELSWRILAMAVAELFALKEQLCASNASDTDDLPSRRSLAETMRALRFALRHLHRRLQTAGLRKRLQTAVTDRYIRRVPKDARYRPPNPDKNRLGEPALKQLNPKQRRKIRQTANQNSA